MSDGENLQRLYCSFVPLPSSVQEDTCRFWTSLVFRVALGEPEPFLLELRNRIFAAIHVDLQLHLKEYGLPLESFCVPNLILDLLETQFSPLIHAILCVHKLNRRYHASKLRKIFVISLLSSESYLDFFVAMLKTNNDHHQFELSDHSLPIEGRHMKGLDEKYAEAFREFFWYQYIFNEGYCGGPCVFKHQLREGDKHKQYTPPPYEGKDIPRKIEDVRSAALTLSLTPHPDCRQSKNVGVSRPCSRRITFVL